MKCCCTAQVSGKCSPERTDTVQVIYDKEWWVKSKTGVGEICKRATREDLENVFQFIKTPERRWKIIYNYLQRGIKNNGKMLIWVMVFTTLRMIAYKLILNEQRRNLWTYMGRLFAAMKVGKLWKNPSTAVVRVAAVLLRWVSLHSGKAPRMKPTQWLQQFLFLQS